MRGLHINWYHELNRHASTTTARLWEAGFILVDIHNQYH